MQHTGSFGPIKIDFVTARDHAQLAEVEVGILALEGIEGPGYLLNTHGEGTITLRQLKCVTDVEVAIRLAHRKHVRVQHLMTLLHAEKTKGESGHFMAIEGAYPNASGGFVANPHLNRQTTATAKGQTPLPNTFACPNSSKPSQ